VPKANWPDLKGIRFVDNAIGDKDLSPFAPQDAPRSTFVGARYPKHRAFLAF
jgi:hypothetical protein